jgi:hypothetical protein
MFSENEYLDAKEMKKNIRRIVEIFLRNQEGMLFILDLIPKNG